jgi:zinc-ribbon domain
MPKTCPQCQSEAADDATFCPSCGTQIGAGGPTAPAATMSAPAGGAGTASAPPPAAAGASSIPAYKFDAARWSLADRIAGIATLVLFICLFLPWYTASVSVLGYSIGGSVNGLWHGWMYLSLILSIAIVAYLVLRAGWDKLPISQDVPHLTIMVAATVVNVVLVLIAFLDKPGGGATGWGVGAILGLIAAVAAAAPYTIPQLRAKTMS